MPSFLQHHAAAVYGMLSGFDRVRFRGTLRRIANGDGMRTFLAYTGVLLKDFAEYVQDVTTQVKRATEAVATAADRPLRYLAGAVEKEPLARAIMQADGVQAGLICTLKTVESCWSFDIHRNRGTKQLDLVPAQRKCLHYYHYFVHPELGVMHVRLQSWFPFTVHVGLNGREWLARQLDAAGLGYRRRENCFIWLEDVRHAQQLVDRQLRTAWPALLNGLVRQINPVHETLFAHYPLPYYWSVDQSEWATDVLFKEPAVLAGLYPALVAHGMQQLGSRDVLRFLGKRVPTVGIDPRFRGEVTSDLTARREGVRVKHRVNGNWIKMYDKQDSVLRVETVINDARDLKVYRRKEGERRGPKQWRRLRKGIADLRRRAEISQRANERYLAALATVTTPGSLASVSRRVCRRVTYRGQSVRALNPLAERDAALLAAINRGEFLLNGFRNRDLRALLYGTAADPDRQRRRQQSAAVTRQLRLLRAHGLIRKISHTNRYQLTTQGRVTIAALLAARHADIATLTAAA